MENKEIAIIIGLIVLVIIYYYYNSQKTLANKETHTSSEAVENRFEIISRLKAEHKQEIQQLHINHQSLLENTKQQLADFSRATQQILSRHGTNSLGELSKRLTDTEQEKGKLGIEKEELSKEHQEQLRAINELFDPAAKDYEFIDFNGLYSLLSQIAERERERESKK